MFKLQQNSTYFTCQQSNVQNFPIQALTICELRTSRYTSWIQKRQRSKCQIANIRWIIEKAREFQKKNKKKHTSVLLTMLKPLTVQITTNCGKFLNRWEYQPPYLPPEKPVFRSRSNSQNGHSHGIKRHLLLGRKEVTHLGSILKSRKIISPTKVHIFKVMVFPEFMYRCESWTIKRLNAEELIPSKCGAGEDSLESLGQQGDPTSQS